MKKLLKDDQSKPEKIRYKFGIAILSTFVLYLLILDLFGIASALFTMLAVMFGVYLLVETVRFFFGSYLTYKHLDDETLIVTSRLPFSKTFTVLIKNPHAIEVTRNEIVVRYSDEKADEYDHYELTADPEGEFVETIAYKIWASPKGWKKFANWLRDLKQRQIIKN